MRLPHRWQNACAPIGADWHRERTVRQLRVDCSPPAADRQTTMPPLSLGFASTVISAQSTETEHSGRCLEDAHQLSRGQPAGRTATEEHGIETAAVPQVAPVADLGADRLHIRLDRILPSGDHGEGAVRTALRTERDVNIQPESRSPSRHRTSDPNRCQRMRPANDVRRSMRPMPSAAGSALK